jgi:septal ring factor EnvC (AmiA/AmiB activator)
MTKHRLPTARRVPASTALLDEPGVLIAPEQREALKHQQVAEDKSAVQQQLAEVQQQLAEAEQKLAREKAELATLQKEQARLIVDRLPIGEISDQIVQMEMSTEQGPAIVACLQERLADLQKEQRQQERGHNLNLQKESARLMESLSEKLVEALQAALNINTTLQACERNYIKLKALTGVDVIGPKVCQGSAGSLQALFETCKQEIEGKRGLRPQQSSGTIPI